MKLWATKWIAWEHALFLGVLWLGLEVWGGGGVEGNVGQLSLPIPTTKFPRGSNTETALRACTQEQTTRQQTPSPGFSKGALSPENKVGIHWTWIFTNPFGFVFTSASAIGRLCVTVAVDMNVLTRLLTSSKSIIKKKHHTVSAGLRVQSCQAA